jgi:hypothetical protein
MDVARGFGDLRSWGACQVPNEGHSGKGLNMKKTVLCILAAVALATPALAADLKMKVKAPPPPPPSPWDLAFGDAIMSDYEFRGITQSNHKPSVAAYFEPRYNFTSAFQGYVGLSGESIDFPNHAAAEIDFYGGFRPTFDKLALDFGAWYYYYPGGQCFSGGTVNLPALNGLQACNSFNAGGNFVPNLNFPGGLTFDPLPNGNVVKANVSWVEAYGKGTWTISDNWSLGGQVYWSPSVANSGAWGTYAAGTLKFTAPSGALPSDIGFYASVDGGYWWFGTSDAFYGVISPGNPSFVNGIPYTNYGNVDFGIGFTWKVFTLDLRGYWSGLNRGDCNAFTSDHTTFSPGNGTAINPGPPTGFGFGSNWCDARFVAKLSSDLTLANLK